MRGTELPVTLCEIAANLQNSSNPKPFWSWLKKIRKNDSGIPQLYHGNEVHTTDTGKAEVLNRYFQSVFTREDTSNLQEIKAKLPGEPCPQSFDVCALSEQEVYEELWKLDVKKACGPDGLPGRLLKEAASFITKPLAKLFTKSLATGSLPSDWKAANVTPIYKKGNCHQPRNY